MRILSLTIASVLGVFFPIYSFNSNISFIIAFLFFLLLGWFFPDMWNKNSLLVKEDYKKVNFKDKTTFRSTNTHAFWIGIFLCTFALVNILKHILINYKINQMSILVFIFGFATIIKVYDFNFSKKDESKISM